MEHVALHKEWNLQNAKIFALEHQGDIKAGNEVNLALSIF
jgi:hypothetical protein